MYDAVLVKILDTINLAVLENTEDRTFRLLSDESEWLSFLFPGLTTSNAVTLLDELDYLGNFITDASTHWRSGELSKLDSGIWSEVVKSGEAYWFEASALNIDGRRILIVKSHGCGLAAQQEREQASKDNLLALENLFRADKDLQKYSDLLEEEVNKRTADLRERVKELNCLYNISGVIGEKSSSLESIFREVVNLIPGGFQYSDIACARLTIGNTTYTTANWQETSRKIDNTITSQGTEIGRLEVCYSEEKDEADTRFLHEEKSMLAAISELLGRATSRNAAEKAAKESQERYSALFDRSLEILYIHDFDGKFLDANPAALESLGYAREEIESLNFTSIIEPKQLPKALSTIQNIFRIGVQDELDEYTLKCKDGHHIDVETKASLIYREGKPYAIQGIARDITEKKKEQEKLEQSYRALNKTFDDTIFALSTIVEIKDRYTAGHQLRVALLAEAIAREMNRNDEEARIIRIAGTIHDIGKIYVPADILSKPGKLSNLEFDIIKTHAQYGYDILKTIEFPWPIAMIVLQHHEKLDGSGYPNGTRGEDILLFSRILTVADVVEAMSSHRPYREALGLGRALEEISRNKGKLYQPDAVDACIRLYTEKGFTFDEKCQIQ